MRNNKPVRFVSVLPAAFLLLTMAGGCVAEESIDYGDGIGVGRLDPAFIDRVDAGGVDGVLADSIGKVDVGGIDVAGADGVDAEGAPGPDADKVCGNGVIDPGEVCDGADLGGATCASEGFSGGILACSASCGAFVTAACTGGAATYGADANPTGNPIGGGDGYVSRYACSERTADYVVRTADELTGALDSSSSGDVIFIPNGTTITIPNATYGKTVKSGVTLCSNRGLDGEVGGKIKWNYYGPTSGYMIPLLRAQSNAVISGLVLEGAGGYGHYGQGAGPCGIRADGSKHVEVENCEISRFRGGGVWFGDGAADITPWNDDSQRNHVHHSYIHNIQQYGFGYGVGLQGRNQSMLIEACIFDENRHSIMNSGGSPSYEVRYCIFGESIYSNSDDGSRSMIQSHQVDSHGGGYHGFKAGTHLFIHHNTFSTNDFSSTKPNIVIRGIVSSECIVEYNWTMKTIRSGGPYDETYYDNGFANLAGEEGCNWMSACEGGPAPNNLLSTGHVYVTDNWYGDTPPP